MIFFGAAIGQSLFYFGTLFLIFFLVLFLMTLFSNILFHISFIFIIRLPNLDWEGAREGRMAVVEILPSPTLKLLLFSNMWRSVSKLCEFIVNWPGISVFISFVYGIASYFWQSGRLANRMLPFSSNILSATFLILHNCVLYWLWLLLGQLWWPSKVLASKSKMTNPSWLPFEIMP